MVEMHFDSVIKARRRGGRLHEIVVIIGPLVQATGLADALFPFIMLFERE